MIARLRLARVLAYREQYDEALQAAHRRPRRVSSPDGSTKSKATFRPRSAASTRRAPRTSPRWSPDGSELLDRNFVQMKLNDLPGTLRSRRPRRVAARGAHGVRSRAAPRRRRERRRRVSDALARRRSRCCCSPRSSSAAQARKTPPSRPPSSSRSTRRSTCARSGAAKSAAAPSDCGSACGPRPTARESSPARTTAKSPHSTRMTGRKIWSREDQAAARGRPGLRRRRGRVRHHGRRSHRARRGDRCGTLAPAGRQRGARGAGDRRRA